MRVLLIGGTGFIGSHVTDACLAAGFDVRILSLEPERFRAPLPAVEYIAGNVADRAVLFGAMHGCEAIVHLAHASTPGSSMTDIAGDLQKNAVPFLGVLDAARETGSRLVYVSSGGTVYGNPDFECVPETAPLRPLSAYGITKVTCELYLEMYRRVHGLNGLIIRPSNAYGPRVNFCGNQGIIPIFMWKMWRGEPIEIWGDGEAARDFVYVEDLASAVTTACVRRDVQGAFNIGSGRAMTVNEILRQVSEVVLPAGAGIYPRIRHTEGRRFDVSRIVLDISAAKRDLDWEPRIDLREGLERTAEWLRNCSPESRA